MIKKIFLGLLGLVVLLIIVGFLLPGKLEMTRSIVVNAPAEYAFEEIDALENWNKWSYWNNIDTSMAITYGEKRTGTGAFYSWQSDQVGEGNLSITESVPFTSIKADLNFMEQGTAKAWYGFEPEGESTKVSMGFSTEFGINPIGRWMGLIMKPEMDKAFDHNLSRIKELAEAKPRFTIPISIENTSPVSYIGLSHTMSPQNSDAVSKQMEKMYTELYAVLAKAKVTPAGLPFCVFPSYSEESMEMITGVPVPPDSKLPSRYKIMQTAGGRAVKAVNTGSYANLEETHQQMDAFLQFRKLEVNNPPWEVYVTDPTMEKDTSKWITEVYYPVN